ncbi:MAG: twin-arginine translocation signal domain-containing protein, partial [Methanosarcinales archaeon]
MEETDIVFINPRMTRRTFLKLAGASAACVALAGRSIAMPNVHTNAPTGKLNPVTPWNAESVLPTIDPTAYVHPQAVVIGASEIGKNVMISPQVAVRGDEGMPLHVGDDSNIQDGVVLHALETVDEAGEEIEGRTYVVNGKKYAVYVGDRVSLA